MAPSDLMNEVRVEAEIQSICGFQQLGLPLTKANLATGSVEYFVVQKLKPNLSACYELSIDVTKPVAGGPGKELDSLQTPTTNTPFARHLNVRSPALNAHSLTQPAQ